MLCCGKWNLSHLSFAWVLARSRAPQGPLAASGLPAQGWLAWKNIAESAGSFPEVSVSRCREVQRIAEKWQCPSASTFVALLVAWPELASGSPAYCRVGWGQEHNEFSSISGLVVEYIVAIDVTRARFPADASWLPVIARVLAVLLLRRTWRKPLAQISDCLASPSALEMDPGARDHTSRKASTHLSGAVKLPSGNLVP